LSAATSNSAQIDGPQSISDPPDLSAFNGGGGGGGPEKWFPPCWPHLTCHSHSISETPPLKSTYHQIHLPPPPPPPGILPNHYPIPLTSLCHRTPLPPVICHIPHTRYPINSLLVTVNHPVITPCHNRHLHRAVKPVSSPCNTIFRCRHCGHRAKTNFKPTATTAHCQQAQINLGNYSPPLIYLKTLLIMAPKAKSC
jgi:hypothetical protein